MTKFHILEAPMSPSTPVRAFEAEVSELLARKADVIGLTNAGPSRHKALLRASRQSGYQLLHPALSEEDSTKIDAPLLVKDGHDVVKAWWVPAVPEEGGATRKSGHGPRGWTCAKIKIADSNETVFVAQASTVSATNDPDEAKREAKNRKVLAKGIATAKRETRGARVGFLLGDSQLADGELTTEGFAHVGVRATKPQVALASVVTVDTEDRITVSRIRRWPATSSDHAPFSTYTSLAAKSGKSEKPEPEPEPESSNVTSIDSKRPAAKKASAKKTVNV